MPAAFRVKTSFSRVCLDSPPTGKPTRQLSLKYNPNHRWYYYPEMKNDEVLAMIGFSCFKDGAYHNAFEDPLTP